MWRISRVRTGQAMVLLVLLMTVLAGAAAMAIDVGMVYSVRQEMQSIAEAAALAGAADLPSGANARATAIYYAGLNGIKASQNGVEESGDTITVTTSFGGDPYSIEVVCRRNVEHAFGRLLGVSQSEVAGRAAALKAKWAGEALPFINLDDDYEVDREVVAWEKVAPGDFESINNYEIVNRTQPDKLYFNINYLDGVVLKKGTVATIKQEVGYIYNSHQPDKPVYTLSLSSAVMRSGQVRLADGTTQSLVKLKNDDVIDPSQLVLLKCIFHDYDYSGKTLFLTVIDWYDIMHGDLPLDYAGAGGQSTRLVR